MKPHTPEGAFPNRAVPRALSQGLCACALAALALACSQNEYSVKGPAPPAPTNPKIAHVVRSTGAPGMNQVAMPDEDQGSGGQGQTQQGAAEQGQGGQASNVTYFGTIALPSSLDKHFKPGETLYIIVRSTDGSPTPVAAQKLVVQAFPIRFQLTEKDAMMGGELPEKADILLRLDTDGDLSTQSPDDLVGGPALAKAGLPITLDLRAPQQ